MSHGLILSDTAEHDESNTSISAVKVKNISPGADVLSLFKFTFIMNFKSTILPS